MSTTMCVFAIQAVQHIVKPFSLFFMHLVCCNRSLVPTQIAFQTGLGTRLSYDLHLLHVPVGIRA